MNIPYIISGNNLAEIRKLRCLSQKELADLSYTSQQTISKLEKSEIVPSLLMAYSISRALKVSIYTIWQLEYVDSPVKLNMYDKK